MLTSRTRRLSLLTLVGAALAVASLAPTASAAAQRYASPAGAGSECSAANPCSIKDAVEGAKTSDEVIVNPGDYPLTATLATPATITIHGVAGQPRPRLLFSGQGQDGLRVVSGSTLRYVAVDQALNTSALFAGSNSSVDQVVATASVETARIQSSTIRNSIVVATGVNGRAIRTTVNGATNTSTYRNVTAIATGSGGVAIQAYALGAAGSATVHATNVIARGSVGLEARTDSTGAQATITATRTNYPGGLKVGSNADIIDGAGNQSLTPAFVNSAVGDYRQAFGSATIGAGLDDDANGALDVDGDPRKLGTTDIGADEFVAAPAATTGPADAIGDQSATLSGDVDPQGAPTSYHFEYGTTTGYGAATAATDAGTGTGVVAATATLGGLSPATTYHYRIVATNSGGVTHGADQTFATATPTTPPHPTAPPATTPPPTAPPLARPFTGVKLVSSRLAFGGRFVTLRLSCPAATVGRCSGQTKLSAPHRRPGSRAAATVVLGRAGFSIAAGEQTKVSLRVSRAGRRLLGRVRRLRGKDTNAARDGAGQSKTTVAAVTIRRHR